jgi:hypothetical protein
MQITPMKKLWQLHLKLRQQFNLNNQPIQSPNGIKTLGLFFGLPLVAE